MIWGLSVKFGSFHWLCPLNVVDFPLPASLLTYFTLFSFAGNTIRCLGVLYEQMFDCLGPQGWPDVACIPCVEVLYSEVRYRQIRTFFFSFSTKLGLYICTPLSLPSMHQSLDLLHIMLKSRHSVSCFTFGFGADGDPFWSLSLSSALYPRMQSSVSVCEHNPS